MHFGIVVDPQEYLLGSIVRHLSYYSSNVGLATDDIWLSSVKELKRAYHSSYIGSSTFGQIENPTWFQRPAL